MTKDEELELSQHVLANDQQAESAGKRLIEANLTMVVSIAQRYRDGGIRVLELVQKGNDGLLLALRTFAETLDRVMDGGDHLVDDRTVPGLVSP